MLETLFTRECVAIQYTRGSRICVNVCRARNCTPPRRRREADRPLIPKGSDPKWRFFWRVGERPEAGAPLPKGELYVYKYYSSMTVMRKSHAIWYFLVYFDRLHHNIMKAKSHITISLAAR